MKRRNKRPMWQKERMGIIAASVFVLSALTLTGVYIAGKDNSSQEENLIDFAKLEQQEKSIIEDKELAQNKKLNNDELSDNSDMDIDPEYTEVNSGHVQNEVTNLPLTGRSRFVKDDQIQLENTLVAEEKKTEAEVQNLKFGEGQNLQWPIVGDVLLNYSMDKAIYFPTMQQYKYNPSIVIAATKGEDITAAADAKVKDIYKDSKIGNAIVFELGNGYELTYGQLEDIQIKKGQYVKAGDVVGKVAEPTIFYSTEGCNIYFKMTKDGTPVNPLEKIK